MRGSSDANEMRVPTLASSRRSVTLIQCSYTAVHGDSEPAHSFRGAKNSPESGAEDFQELAHRGILATVQ